MKLKNVKGKNNDILVLRNNDIFVTKAKSQATVMDKKNIWIG